jgi:outer membrane protein OmpA-like peptidoglycan-associated protein
VLKLIGQKCTFFNRNTDLNTVIVYFVFQIFHNRDTTMKTICWLAGLCLLTTLAARPAGAQFKEIGFEVGAYAGVTMDNNSSTDAKTGASFRSCIAYPILNPLQGEIGWAYAELRAKDLNTTMAPLDFRLRFSPIYSSKWIPYVYAGIGALYHDVHHYPAPTNPDAHSTGWNGYVPAGAGVQYRVDKYISVDLNGGYNLAFTDNLNPAKTDKTNQSYLTAMLGMRVGGGPRETDPDHDGLSNAEEKRLGTDPKNPDTDGDGLSDGDEVLKYHTDPLKKDTDGDGLSDGDEVKVHNTDPLKADTDGDGLSDGDEVLKYLTNPLKADTDGDGLTDGDEVLKYHTDPLKADTDGDKLTDGDEVLKYHTDPLKKDTDGGTVDDGTEIARGTNPLDPTDDVPKIQLEVGKKIVLEGIEFKVNSAEILSTSEQNLGDALATLKANPDIAVEVNGYTDNSGSRAHNMKLSQDRADAVRNWLVAKGITGERITAKGYGPDNPIAPNTTPENKQKNRRIEFVRTK